MNSANSSLVHAPHRGAFLFVWGTWTILFILLIVYSLVFASDIPIMDIWDLVPELCGAEPVDLGWLWEQHNEHRIPLPKLIIVGLVRLTGGFRALSYFNTAVLGCLAALLIAAARRLRGHTAYADAFFPCLLLHWGHGANILLQLQVQFIVSTFVTIVILLIMLRSSVGLTARTGLLVGLCLLALSLCGANGLVMVPAIGLWLIIVSRRSLKTRLPRTACIMLGIVAIVVVLLSWVGYKSPEKYSATTDVLSVCKVALQFWTMTFGPVGQLVFPGTADVPLLGVLTVGLGITGLAAIVRAWRQHQQERIRTTGMFLFLASFAVLGLGIGFGRAEAFEKSGMVDRYILLASPILCCLYFVFVAYCQKRARRLSQIGWFFVMAVLLPYNLSWGYNLGRYYILYANTIERDIRAGTPADVIAARYHVLVFCPDETTMHDRLEMLRKAGIGPYKGSSTSGGTPRNEGVQQTNRAANMEL